jgi:hemerythrin-like metal-binding protein
MQAVVWDASYEVGHPVFDQEHHRLVDMIGRLQVLDSAQAHPAEVSALLDELVTYSETHFAHEEEEMILLRVDRRHQLMHVAAHRAFEREARNLRAKPVEGLNVASLVQLLVDWLVGHIVAHDRVMVRQLVAIRGGHTPAQAYTECHLAVQVAASRGVGAITSADIDLAASETLLEQVVEGAPVATLVIGVDHRVMYWNRACAQVSGVPAHAVVGTRDAWRGFYAEPRPILANLMLQTDEPPMARIHALYGDDCQPSPVVPGAMECEQFFPALGPHGRWLHFTAALLCDARGRPMGAIETLEDVTERNLARQRLMEAQVGLERQVAARTEELVARNAELTRVNHDLLSARQQLVQAEKLASIGQLSAGVAHEINNPIGYVYSNLSTLAGYAKDVAQLLTAYGEAETHLADDAVRQRLADLRQRVDLDFLLEDLPNLISESLEGAARVKKIVQDLKDFSRAESHTDFVLADIHKGLDSTLNIAANEIKYRADVVRDYGALPLVECVLSQLNQVFMNLLVNAAQAMPPDRRGTIRVSTRVDGPWACIDVQDDGCGMPPDVLGRVFDPFFTTKPVGKGTGLGLSLAYGIVQNHGGTLTVDSQPGVGTTFHIKLPLLQAQRPSKP